MWAVRSGIELGATLPLFEPQLRVDLPLDLRHRELLEEHRRAAEVAATERLPRRIPLPALERGGASVERGAENGETWEGRAAGCFPLFEASQGAPLLLRLLLAERHLLAVEPRHALDEPIARALLRLRRPRRLERAHALGEVGQQLALVVGRARQPVQERAMGGRREEVRRRPLAGEDGLVGRLGEARRERAELGAALAALAVGQEPVEDVRLGAHVTGVHLGQVGDGASDVGNVGRCVGAAVASHLELLVALPPVVLDELLLLLELRVEQHLCRWMAVGGWSGDGCGG